MLSLPLVVSFVAWSYLVERYFSLRRNVKIAEKVKLPYVVVPVYTITPLWYFCYPPILWALSTLPTRWTYPWLDFLDPYWSWKLHYEPFARLQSDTIIVVAPGGLIFCTCDPNIITEVAGRRWDFCKPIESYVFLNLFGPSLVTQQGSSWRAHQKLVAPAFSERNAKLVWEESLSQAQYMIESWCDDQQAGAKYIPAIREDTLTVPFHIINKAGFGVNLPWPKRTNSTRSSSGASAVDRISRGHRMTYRQALQTTVTHLFHLLIFPDWLLRIAPFAYAKLLRMAHHESIDYLKELMTQREEELKTSGIFSRSRYGIDIMSALIFARVKHQSASKAEVLTEEAILSNVFILLIAGHETSATVLLIALIELSLNIDCQRQLQQELDEIFGIRPPSSWDLYSDVEKLFGSMLGAVMNETMRLYPPANVIPKATRPNNPQNIVSGDQEFTVPANTSFIFVATCAHRNPKYWPSGPAPPGKNDDLDEFQPQRWFRKTSSATCNARTSSNVAKVPHDEEAGVEVSDEVLSEDTSAALFRPYPGSYIPFSAGHRSCIGRRFAQVEILAVLAVIFKSYSLELDVTDFADDKAVARMNDEEKKEVWEKAAARMRNVLREGMRHHLTMQLKKGKIAVRLIRRGEERFT